MHKLLHQSWPLDGNLTQHFGGAVPNILEFLWMKTYSMGKNIMGENKLNQYFLNCVDKNRIYCAIKFIICFQPTTQVTLL